MRTEGERYLDTIRCRCRGGQRQFRFVMRWGTVFSRRSGAGKGSSEVVVPAGEQQGGEARSPALSELDSPVLVDEYDGLVLLRSSPAALPGPEDVAELAALLAAAEQGSGLATVVVGVEGVIPVSLWTRLGSTLDTLRASGTTTVRLVLAGAGSGTAERPALAQQIADAWEIGVIAAEGNTLIVPGGSLFVPDHLTPNRGWQLFTSTAEPVPLGPRNPAPAWQTVIGRLPPNTATGCVVEHLPAGVLIHSPRARPPQPGDLCYAVPVDPHHPVVLVGMPGPDGGADVPSDDLAAVYTALPVAERAQVRLAPGNHRDLLPAAQDVADSLGIEVELLTGLPLVAGAAAGGTGGRGESQPILVGSDGIPTWQPHVQAVVCRPATESGVPIPPRLLRWHPPVPSFGEDEPNWHGAVSLSDHWQLTVTRSGLGLGPNGQQWPLAARPVIADQLAVDISLPAGTPVDDSFFLVLSRVLFDLKPEVREFVTLYAPPGMADAGRRLRRLAVRHGVRVLWPPTPGIPAIPPTSPAVQVSAPNLDSAAALPPVRAARASSVVAALTGGTPALETAPEQSAEADGRPGGAGQADAMPPGGAGTAVEAAAEPVAEAAADDADGSEAAAAAVRLRDTAERPALTDYRDLVGRIAEAVEAADSDYAVALAASLERRGFSAHGDTALTSLMIRQLRARVCAVAGQHALAADLHRDVALKLLAQRGADDADTQQAAAEADACWRAVFDVEEARRLAPSIVALLRRILGPDGRPAQDAEKYAAELGALADATAATGPPPGRRLTQERPVEPKVPATPVRRDEPEGTSGPDHAPTPGPEADESSAGAPPSPKRSVPTDPVKPVKAVGWVGSRVPVEPVGPVGPRIPVRPVRPVGSADPEQLTGAQPSEDASTSSPRVPPVPGTPAARRQEPTPVRDTAVPDDEQSTAPTPPTVPPVSAADLPLTTPVPPAEPDDQLPAGQPPAPRPAAPSAPRSVAGGVQAGPAFVPARRSTEAERGVFREAAQEVWDRHSAAVSRVITRMPALRGHELGAARTDLVAVHAYLTVDDGPFSAAELTRALAEGSRDEDVAAFAACLVSGLGRLPSYRGVAVRGGSLPPGLAPGQEFHVPGPVSALLGGAAGPAGPEGRCVIWSATGRRVRSLLGAAPDEVVFAPGTSFRALQVSSGDEVPLALLREVPGIGAAGTGSAGVGLDDMDRAVLKQLQVALEKSASAARGESPQAWPPRCVGPMAGPLPRPR
ncbi:hypothetical protein ACIRQQ_22295 [Streptomyces fuscichromogenes]|uniref:hypothetical protein n=1 Tax=Streptomyces fuscichromogenes TaxID=1324013 RepID=UPI0038243F5E